MALSTSWSTAFEITCLHPEGQSTDGDEYVKAMLRALLKAVHIHYFLMHSVHTLCLHASVLQTPCFLHTEQVSFGPDSAAAGIGTVPGFCCGCAGCCENC